VPNRSEFLVSLLKVLNALEINKSERSFVTKHYLIHMISSPALASQSHFFIVHYNDFYGNEPNDAVLKTRLLLLHETRSELSLLSRLLLLAS